MSKEEMKVSMNVNGQSKVPPGFRFHPTEEELLHYYLRKKVCCEQIDLDVIREVDLNKLEPWDIQEKCNIGSNQQNDWYCFSHKDKKYPTGTRTNRATAAGFWKATGRDKVIRSSHQRTGMRKTLVFYKGRAPHGHKSDWIMHEYRLDGTFISIQDSNASTHEEGWVVCRLFKKKNYHKSFDTPQRSSYAGSMQHDAMQPLMTSTNDMFIHLPALDSPTMTTTSQHMSSTTFDHGSSMKNYNSMCDNEYDQCSNWADLDKFVATELDVQMERNEPVLTRNNEEDIWSLARSPLDQFDYLSF
ncbi:hypothetical protein QVD17_04378 [Tagetes erecta]|uniref:NAC domain-containing protein n=1 Tax=Tagetes erecta TaxID=13708 RepID=A0AAD8LA10_TARER|nr:hypothetical protein QVD17_04378 [Tagetes erecta]